MIETQTEVDRKLVHAPGIAAVYAPTVDIEFRIDELTELGNTKIRAAVEWLTG